MTLVPGDSLGRYQIIARIGGGATGEVYRAADRRLQREVAVKVLSLGDATDADRIRRFEEEAKAIAALNHPNILMVFDVDEHEGTPFLVTELLLGETLRSLLRRGPVQVAAVADCARQIAEGLAVAHEIGLVHRDLKPENIFVANGGRVKILDFGLATIAWRDDTTRSEAITRASLTPDGKVVGTLRYMAPEQLRGDRVSPAADIFSFGLVLHEMLTGEPLFLHAEPVAVMAALATHRKYDSARLRANGRAHEFRRLVSRCLAKDPAERPTARELALELKKPPRGRRELGPAPAPRAVAARVARGPTGVRGSGEAEQALAKARFLMDARLGNWLQESFSALQKAVRASPAFVPARVQLSRWYLFAAIREEIPYDIGLIQATREAEHALALEPDSPAGLAALARAYHVQRRFAEAEQNYKKAIAGNPMDADALSAFSDLLTLNGRHDEAIDLVNRALALDPESGYGHFRKAAALFAARRFEQCVDWSRQAVDVFPRAAELWYFAGASWLMLANYAEATRYLERALECEPRSAGIKIALVIVLARADRKDESSRLLVELEQQNTDLTLLAEAYASADRYDDALKALEEAFRRDSPQLMGIMVNPFLDPVRDHPRFRRLLRAIGFHADNV